MKYNRTVWKNDVTPLNERNLNNIEEGIVQNETDNATLLDRLNEAIDYIQDVDAEKTTPEYVSVSIKAHDDSEKSHPYLLDLISDRYTKTETDDAIRNAVANLIGEAPEDLNTLQELVAYLKAHETEALDTFTELNDRLDEHINAAELHVPEETIKMWEDHITNEDVHTSTEEREYYNAHIDDEDVHVTLIDKANWDGKAEKIHSHMFADIYSEELKEDGAKKNLNEIVDGINVNIDNVNTKVDNLTTTFNEHNHDDAYASVSHNHDDAYSPLSHNHDDLYATLNHSHDEAYASISHNHDDAYAPLSHNHDDVYAEISHTHDDLYAELSHTHDEYLTEDKAKELFGTMDTVPDWYNEKETALLNSLEEKFTAIDNNFDDKVSKSSKGVQSIAGDLILRGIEVQSGIVAEEISTPNGFNLLSYNTEMSSTNVGDLENELNLYGKAGRIVYHGNPISSATGEDEIHEELAFLSDIPEVPNIYGGGTIEVTDTSTGTKINSPSPHLYASLNKNDFANTAGNNPYIALTGGSKVYNSLRLKGSGTVTVTSDESGNITINGNDLGGSGSNKYNTLFVDMIMDLPTDYPNGGTGIKVNSEICFNNRIYFGANKNATSYLDSSYHFHGSYKMDEFRVYGDLNIGENGTLKFNGLSEGIYFGDADKHIYSISDTLYIEAKDGVHINKISGELYNSNEQAVRGFKTLSNDFGYNSNIVSGFYANAFSTYDKSFVCGDNLDKAVIQWDYSSGWHFRVSNNGEEVMDKILIDNNGNIAGNVASGGVDLTSTQTITGAKTFANKIKLTGTASTSSGGYINWGDNNYVYIAEPWDDRMVINASGIYFKTGNSLPASTKPTSFSAKSFCPAVGGYLSGDTLYLFTMDG